MIIDREVSTDIMLILTVTFDKGNQYRTKKTLRDSFNNIQFLEPATVLDIQITARVIDK